MTAPPDALPPGVELIRPVAYAMSYGGAVRLALTPDEAGPLLGVTGQVVRDLCRTGRLRATNLHPGSRNGRYLIPISALVDFLGESNA